MVFETWCDVGDSVLIVLFFSVVFICVCFELLSVYMVARVMCFDCCCLVYLIVWSLMWL